MSLIIVVCGISIARVQHCRKSFDILSKLLIPSDLPALAGFRLHLKSRNICCKERQHHMETLCVMVL